MVVTKDEVKTTRNTDAPQNELEHEYVQQDCLGEGGFGSVYAGYRRDDLLPVAIKHVPKNNVKHITVILDGEQEEFPLEVVLLAIAGKVEAVAGETRCVSVTLLDWYELQEELVIVMERPVPSIDLFHYIQDSGSHVQEEQAKVILRQLVEAIVSLLSKGVLHRDIKPENILVHTDPEGLRIRILDFGVGSILREGHTSFYGSAEYPPSECCLQAFYQAEPSIVWQIGIVLYVMLHGERPFSNTWEMMSKDPYLRDQLSRDCEDLLRSCLDKRSRSRLSLHDILQHPWLK
ncbi:hypothetical protein AOLI_G00195090 [Acnodon oligacanthus]